MNTKTLQALDKKYIWHPFTQMQEWVPEDVLIVASGKGPYLSDTGGKRYLDGVSSLWCNVHGHRVSALDAAVRRQLGKVAHSTFLGLSNVPAIALSEKLVKLAPAGLTKVFYSDSGSEAVEIALKMAYQYWSHKGRKQKRKFLHLTNAYHGDTIGSVSVGGIEIFHQIFKPLLFETLSAAGPDRYHEKFEGSDDAYAALCAKRIEKVLHAHADETAAIILEPLVQGAAGMITHPAGFLSKVRELSRRHDVLLILDEVATGFGRTGPMFACQKEGVTPDILCLAKGLSGGYLPLAATLASEDVYDAFLGKYEEFKTFFHGHTYTANPLACAAAAANLDYFKKQRVLEKNKHKIRVLAKQLAPFSKMDHVGDVRQAGLMAGIELVKDKETRAPFSLELKIGAKVCRKARDLGAILRPLGNVIVLMPSFAFSERQIKELCDITAASIREVTEKP